MKHNIQIRDLKPANVKMFSEELGAVNWESIFRENNPSSAFEKFNTTLLGIYDLTCPLKSMKIRKKAARKPWVDDELLRMIDIRNALYTAHINEPNEFSSAQFKDQRNLVNSTRRKKMRNFYGEEFKKNASNPKATWKIINEVIRGSPAPQQYSLNSGGEIVRDLDKVCDLFAYHFSKIGETVQSEAAVNNELLIEESTFEDLRGQDFEMKLEPCDSVEIEKIVSSIKSNSAGTDGLNLRTLKSVLPNILPVLVFLINLSMAEGQFPCSLKMAKVIPLPKSGTLSDLSNWRPISILPIISKLYEKIVHKRLYEHLTNCGFLSETQFGFRKRHSTVHAALNLIDKVNGALEKKLFLHDNFH